MDIYLLIIWIIIFIISTKIENKKINYRGNHDKIKTVLIILTLYYIGYFLSGLKFGYSNSPYSSKINEIIKNIINIASIRLMQEYVRTKLLNRKKSTWNYIIITLIFAIINLEYTKLNSQQEFFKFILAELLPKIAESLLLTYLSLNGGYQLNYAYTITNIFVTILAPIFPNLDWFLNAVLKYVQYLVIFLFINYESTIRKSKKSKRDLKREKPIKSIISILGVTIIICFIIGVFPYKPIAIISNSMYPEFSRGSIVIIKGYNNKTQIKVNDIIEYELNGRGIIHRVIKIQEEGLNPEYITKGDNNQEHDLLTVKENQIVGIVKYKIPYLGYPSVWFSEIFLSK